MASVARTRLAISEDHVTDPHVRCALALYLSLFDDQCSSVVFYPPNPFTSHPFLAMSDSDEAFSDELLELAGATDKKRKRRQNGAKGSKRRKAECVTYCSIPLPEHSNIILTLLRATAQSESEGDGPESEEEENDLNPYPLENKYTDEYDREQCVVFSLFPRII